jgi:hypothetical protein
VTFPVEEIYRTEGVPEYTFVRPPNYDEILVDLRHPGKPMVVEGQSGTGKTTAVRKIVERALPSSDFQYLSARKASDVAKVGEIAASGGPGSYVIDDFHRLANHIQEKLGDIVKIAAEENEPKVHPIIVLIGINRVGSELIHFVPDVAKRIGIHRIQPADEEGTLKLIERGEEKLNITIENKDAIFGESRGDYWVTQLLCQMICLLQDITETIPESRSIPFDISLTRNRVPDRLDSKPICERYFYVGIKFVRNPSKILEDQITDDIVFRLLERLDDV